MKHYFFLLTALLCGITASVYSQTGFRVINLKCNNRTNPVGVDASPVFSWQITSDKRNLKQASYRIIVSDDSQKLNKNEGNCWDSKKINSGRSIQVIYKGSPLVSDKNYYWKVMVFNTEGKSSGWSETGSFQTGLLKQEDWSNAKWIGYEDMPASLRLVPGVHGNGDKLKDKAVQRPVIPLLRKGFEIKKTVASASLFITGLGQYEAYINGIKTGNSFLTPGWSDYDKTILYNTYDVTCSLRQGQNVLSAVIGNGFYNINRERYRKLVIAYGMPKMICKLKIKYSDGTEEEIVSDAGWKVAVSPITYSGIYGGEDYDARMEQAGWSESGFDDSKWKNVVTVSVPAGKLVPEQDYPVAIKDTIEVKKIYKLSDGKYLYDFGQNASGIVALKVKGEKGESVKLIPAELIKGNREVNQRATGDPYYYTYTLKGNGTEVWQPKFTYYGFRYLQVEGAVPDTAKVIENLPRISEIKMLHNRNSAPQNGSFICSNDLFNRINTLINWAIRSNMQSLITDCPHREKLGWLEQTFLMGNSINYNYDIYQLYKRTILNMIDAQTTEGLVPDIAPEYVPFEAGFRDSPEWGSASVILPWLVYKWYGDISIIEDAWAMMNKYVYYLSGKSKNNILSHGLGDWYDLGPKFPGEAQLTPKEVTATSIYYYDVKILAEMAGILNKKEDKARLAKLAEDIRRAFNDKFFNASACRYSTGSQTAMAMPLCFGMVDPGYRERTASNLISSIIAGNKAVTAGDIGFHYLVEALTDIGASQLLFEMNNRDDVPGYGLQLKKGATTLTESWNALEEVSNNHLMLGHLMEWFYSGVGGIRQKESSVAFKNLLIKPFSVGDITNAKTSYNSPYGTVVTDWKKEGNKFSLHITVPGNSSAEVYLPVKKNQAVKEGNMPVKNVRYIKFMRNEEEYKVYLIGSGEYHFIVE